MGNIRFGEQERREISLMVFCEDPDGSGLPWFRSRDETEDTTGRKLLGRKSRRYEGECYDTMKYISHWGELVKSCVEAAPRGTELVGLKLGGATGTRTFFETVSARYYGPQKE